MLNSHAPRMPPQVKSGQLQASQVRVVYVIWGLGDEAPVIKCLWEHRRNCITSLAPYALRVCCHAGRCMSPHRMHTQVPVTHVVLEPQAHKQPSNPHQPAPPLLQAWQQLCRQVLHPGQPFELHKQLYQDVYAGWEVSLRGPRPIWVPGPEDVMNSNLSGFMARFHVGGCLACLCSSRERQGQ